MINEEEYTERGGRIGRGEEEGEAIMGSKKMRWVSIFKLRRL